MGISFISFPSGTASVAFGRTAWTRLRNTLLGAAFPIFHAHEARRSLMNLNWGDLQMSVATDKIVFNMSERTGNIWLVKLEGRK